MDKHMQQLAANHLETKFIKVLSPCAHTKIFSAPCLYDGDKIKWLKLD